ncbi:hypothetical protein HDU67_001293 [Dinochytrium kinnereticum]|nr:hypothetical protein HDU67_001293 [Dinochytrium kinnereticum]
MPILKYEFEQGTLTIMVLTAESIRFQVPAGCKLNAEWAADFGRSTSCDGNAAGLECINNIAGWKVFWTGTPATSSDLRSKLYEDVRQFIKNGEPVCEQFTLVNSEENWSINARRITPAKSRGAQTSKTSSVIFALAIVATLFGGLWAS